jgi:hypothetical protein
MASSGAKTPPPLKSSEAGAALRSYDGRPGRHWGPRVTTSCRSFSPLLVTCRPAPFVTRRPGPLPSRL